MMRNIQGGNWAATPMLQIYKGEKLGNHPNVEKGPRKIFKNFKV